MTTCLNCGHDTDAEFLFCPQCGTKAPESSGEPYTLIGKTLNEKYRVTSEIGSGAMGTVYLGEHVGLKKKVALKVLHPDLRLSDEQLQRFQREGIAAGKFSHPNAIQIFDFDKTEGRVIYLAMEYVEGANLRVYLRRKGRLPVGFAVRITRQILDCLAEAHRHGIVHRDLKPDNIMVVTASRGDVRIKVLDFGLSKLVAIPGNESSLVTQAGRILGTPLYMSPEQCAGEETDARSDLYAVGLILYEMVAGIRPFPEESTSDLLFSRATKEAPSLLEEFPDMDVPAEIDEVLVRSLARRRDDRFQSAEEFLAALEAVSVGSDSWSASTTGVPSRVVPAAAAASARGDGDVTVPESGKGKGFVIAFALGGIAALALLVIRGLGDAGTDAVPEEAPAARVREIAVEERDPIQEQYLRTLDLARTALRSGNPSAARGTVSEAFLSPSVDAEAFLVQGEIFEALDRDDTFVDAMLALGILQLDRGELAEARDQLTRAADVAPESAPVHASLGVAAYRLGESEVAEDELARALELDPKNAEAHLFVGRLHLDAGRRDEAVDSLVQAKLADPLEWRAPVWLGDAYLALGRADDAEAQWRGSLDIADTADARRNVAALLVDARRFVDAEIFLDEAVREHPSDGRLRILLGATRHGSGKIESAIEALERGVQLEPDAEARGLLGLLYHTTGKLDEAAAQYESIRRDSGEVPTANLGLGLVNFQRGRYEEAARHFQLILDFEPDDLAAHLYLGLVQMNYLGDAEAARAHLERYLALGGTDGRVNGWLRKLGN